MREPKIDDLDREFMDIYNVSETQMKFFKVMYRRECALKRIILLLLLLIGTAVVYCWLR